MSRYTLWIDIPQRRAAMKGYGQFCPVAKASEIIGERWTLLILRELVAGSHRFNEIRRGIPLISPTLLSQRLKGLETAGVVRRVTAADAQGTEYHLTDAGMELRPIVELAGTWGHRWARTQLQDEELDAGVLMWDMRRRIQTQHLPKRPLTLYFHYPDGAKGHRDFWILVRDGTADLCLVDPGTEPDLSVVASLRTMTAIWIGDLSVNQAKRSDDLKLYGPQELIRNMWAWLGLSVFADVRPQ